MISRIRGRSPSRRAIALMLLPVLAVACVVSPDATSDIPFLPVEPTPTRLEPVGEGVEVAWRNLSDETFTLTVANGDTLRGVAEVAACQAGAMNVQVEEPFVVGVGQDQDARGDVLNPERPYLTSSQLDGSQPYRVLIQVSPAGEITAAPLVGPAAAGDVC